MNNVTFKKQLVKLICWAVAFVVATAITWNSENRKAFQTIYMFINVIPGNVFARSFHYEILEAMDPLARRMSTQPRMFDLPGKIRCNSEHNYSNEALKLFRYLKIYDRLIICIVLLGFVMAAIS